MGLSCLIPMIIGTAVGILFGAMPGMSATLAVAVFIPLTYTMDVSASIALLMSLYIGGISGGLISSILINIPGTPSSVATTFDGHPMAKKGEGGKALGVGVVYSFLGMVFSIAALMFIAPILAKFAFNFGFYEYFAITSCAFLLVAGLAGDNMPKGLISASFGVFFSLVGMAPLDGVHRFTFGSVNLTAGLATLPFMVGLFALPELLKYVSVKDVGFEKIAVPKIKGFGFSIKEFITEIPNMFRATAVGLGIGVLPGIGAATSNLMAYAVVKNASKHPEKFGTGIMSGVVASETANNVTLGAGMIPLLSLGIPGDAVTAILLGALMVKGIQPGPMLFRTSPDTIYMIYAAMITASVLMLLIEFYGLRIFVRLLSIPRQVLLPVVMVICILGAYTSTNTIFSMWVLFIFGIVGYVFSECKIPLAPCIIGFVLGPICEVNLRRGLQLSGGDIMPFITSPISSVFYVVSALFILWKVARALMKLRKH